MVASVLTQERTMLFVFAIEFKPTCSRLAGCGHINRYVVVELDILGVVHSTHRSLILQCRYVGPNAGDRCYFFAKYL